MKEPGAVRDLAKRAAALVQAHPASADAMLALGFSVAGLVSVRAVFDEIRTFDAVFEVPSTAAVVAAMLGITLPLAWRRRFPLAVAGVVVTAFLLGRIVVDIPEASITVLACSLAIYSVAVHGRPRLRTPALVVCFGAILAEVVRELFFVPEAADLKPLTQTFLLTYNVVVLSLPWALGAVIRSLRERQRELAERASELQREREENARQAVFAERVHIARELHDVVAHHVSVMGVQAGAARRVMERQPEKAVAALSSIETSSRQAVVELHRLLGFLRRSDEADDIAPQPGLAQLGDLIAQVADGELSVDLAVEGVPQRLSPTLELSAYRIIQEALTNTRRHSGGMRASVRVRHRGSTLQVEVLDDGPGSDEQPAGHRGGHGLIGMRERTTLHGGHLAVGPRPSGGFAVLATFPLNGSAL